MILGLEFWLGMLLLAINCTGLFLLSAFIYVVLRNTTGWARWQCILVIAHFYAFVFWLVIHGGPGAAKILGGLPW